MTILPSAAKSIARAISCLVEPDWLNAGAIFPAEPDWLNWSHDKGIL